MEGKMAAGAFGRARNYGWDGPFKESKLLCLKHLTKDGLENNKVTRLRETRNKTTENRISYYI